MSNFACVARLDFSDGGEPEFIVLHEGTEAECIRMADGVPAVAYSGKRPVKDCRVAVFQERL
jgi:hypothetical protein